MKIAFAKGDIFDTTMYPQELTFPELASLFKEPKQGPKGTAGYFIRGGEMSLSNPGTPMEHYHRNDVSLISGELLVIDADKGKDGVAPHLSRIHDALKSLKIRHFGYTSSSHTEAAPKCRVVIPCSMPSRAHLVPTMAKLLSILDEQECYPRAGGSEDFTWSIPWFFSTVHDGAYFVEYHRGSDFEAVQPGTYEAESICMRGGVRHPGSGMTMAEARELLWSGESGFHIALHCAAWYLQKELGDNQAIAELQYLTRHQALSPSRKEIPGYIKDIPRMVSTASNKQHGSIPFPQPMYYSTSKFPDSVLPKAFYDMAEQIQHFVGVSFEFPAVFSLGLISLASGRRVTIEEIQGIQGDGLSYHNALWVTVVLPSGERKSPVVKLLLKPIKDAESILIEEFKRDSRMLKVQAMSLEQAIKDAEKRVKENGPKNLTGHVELADLYEQQDELKKALYQPQIFTTDATEEAVKKLASKNDGVVGMANAEGSSTFRNITNQYGDDPKASTLLALYSGDEVRVNRAGEDEPILIEDGVLNMCTTVQPDAYAAFIDSDGLRDQGVLARIFAVMPQRMVGTRTKSTLLKKYNHEIQKPYNDLVFNLLTHKAPIHCIMSENANTLYERFYDEIELSMAPGAANHKYADVINKLPSEMLKYATNIQMSYSPEIAVTGGDLIITGKAVTKAIRLSRYILETKIYSDEQSHHDMLIEKAISFIESIRKSKSGGAQKMLKEGSFNRGHLSRQGGTTYRDDLDDITEVLVDYNWIIPEGIKNGGPIYSFCENFRTARLREEI